jgi:hypothetical protein
LSPIARPTLDTVPGLGFGYRLILLKAVSILTGKTHYY